MDKYNILDSYAFNDKEDEDNELRELEKDLMLDNEFLESIQNKEKERGEIQLELENSRKLLSEQESNIKSLENKLAQLN